ncbi:hypothetical protein N5P37_008861 [Trichoderma harzianum]|nr:hypothetical protein N5P37_008861 [Trichoderma harzianum]
MEGLILAENPFKGKKCFNCREMDHIAKVCPKPRVRRAKKQNYRLLKQIHSKCTFNYYNGGGDNGKKIVIMGKSNIIFSRGS